ncbi:MAG: GAF domain-containing protein [Anaerolineae bacterium]
MEEPTTSMMEEAIPRLREYLTRRVTRRALIVAVVLFVLSVYYLASVRLLWGIPLAFLVFVLMLVGGLVSLPIRTRAWAAVIATMLAGTIDLLVRGWQGNARLYYVVAVALTALALNAKVAYGLLAIASLFLLAFAGSRGLGLSLPLVAADAQPPLSAMIGGWVLFAALGGALVASLQFLLSRFEVVLQREEERYAVLWKGHEELNQDFSAIQDSNARLRRRIAQLKASQAVEQFLATVFELGALLNRAAELIASQFGLYHVGIFLVDGTGAWAILRAASSTVGKEMALHSHRVAISAHSVVASVVKQRRPRIVDYDRDDEGYTKPSGLTSTRSEMALPIMFEDQMIGVLDLHSQDAGVFEEEDMTTLEGLTTHLALAIQNARRLRDEASVLETASPFYRTANRLAKARVENEVYSVIVETLRDFSPSRLLIVRTGRVTGDLTIVADMQGESVDFAEQDLADLKSPELIDVILMGLSLDLPLWAADLNELDPSLSPELAGALTELTESSDVAGLALLPIRTEGRTVEGSVAVLHTAVHHFTPIERRLHQLLTELGAAALERTQLLSQARARLEQERLLSDIGDELRSSFDPDMIMRTTAQGIGRVLGAELTSIEITPPDESETASETESEGASEAESEGTSEAKSEGASEAESEGASEAKSEGASEAAPDSTPGGIEEDASGADPDESSSEPMDSEAR